MESPRTLVQTPLTGRRRRLGSASARADRRARCAQELRRAWQTSSSCSAATAWSGGSARAASASSGGHTTSSSSATWPSSASGWERVTAPRRRPRRPRGARDRAPVAPGDRRPLRGVPARRGLLPDLRARARVHPRRADPRGRARRRARPAHRRSTSSTRSSTRTSAASSTATSSRRTSSCPIGTRSGAPGRPLSSPTSAARASPKRTRSPAPATSWARSPTWRPSRARDARPARRRTCTRSRSSSTRRCRASTRCAGRRPPPRRDGSARAWSRSRAGAATCRRGLTAALDRALAPDPGERGRAPGSARRAAGGARGGAPGHASPARATRSRRSPGTGSAAPPGDPPRGGRGAPGRGRCAHRVARPAANAVGRPRPRRARLALRHRPRRPGRGARGCAGPAGGDPCRTALGSRAGGLGGVPAGARPRARGPRRRVPSTGGPGAALASALRAGRARLLVAVARRAATGPPAVAGSAGRHPCARRLGRVDQRLGRARGRAAPQPWRGARCAALGGRRRCCCRWLVRGASAAVDVFAATVWSAAVVAAAPALDAGLAAGGHPLPRGAVLARGRWAGWWRSAPAPCAVRCQSPWATA